MFDDNGDFSLEKRTLLAHESCEWEDCWSEIF